MLNQINQQKTLKTFADITSELNCGDFNVQLQAFQLHETKV